MGHCSFGWARAPQVIVIFGVLALLLGGTTALMLLEKWEFAVAFYAATQLLTSVGFGDYVPSKDTTRLLVAFYAVVCLVLFVYFCSITTHGVFNLEFNALSRYLEQVERRLDENAPRKSFLQRQRRVWTLLIASVSFAAMITLGMLFFALFNAQEARSSFLRGFCASVTTLSTTGFGDLTAHSAGWQVFCALWMLGGIATMLQWVIALASWLLERTRLKQFRIADSAAGSSHRCFARFDSQSTGQLSRGEFMAYTLLKYGLVGEELVGLLDSLYEKIIPRGVSPQPSPSWAKLRQTTASDAGDQWSPPATPASAKIQTPKSVSSAKGSRSSTPSSRNVDVDL